MSDNAKETLSAYERWELPSVGKDIYESDSQVTFENIKSSGLLTEEQIASIHGHAYQQGLEEGYEQGFKTGKTDVENKLAAAKQILSGLIEPLELMNDLVEQELVALVIQIAQHVTLHELKSSPEHILTVVEKAKHLLPVASQKIILQLNPEDAPLIEEAMQEVVGDKWQINKNPSITRGGCQFTTETTQVDASIEAQIKNVFVQVFGEDVKLSEPPDDSTS